MKTYQTKRLQETSLNNQNKKICYQKKNGKILKFAPLIFFGLFFRERLEKKIKKKKIGARKKKKEQTVVGTETRERTSNTSKLEEL